MSNIVNETGYIIDPVIRAKYDRLANRGRWSASRDSAEAFLALVLRLEAKGRLDLVEVCKR